MQARQNSLFEVWQRARERLKAVKEIRKKHMQVGTCMLAACFIMSCADHKNRKVVDGDPGGDPSSEIASGC